LQKNGTRKIAIADGSFIPTARQRKVFALEKNTPRFRDFSAAEWKQWNQYVADLPAKRARFDNLLDRLLLTNKPKKRKRSHGIHEP